MPFTVDAQCRELPYRDVEDGGQPFDLAGGEPALSAAASAFGGTHGGVGWLAHLLAELCLAPSSALAEGADVRTDDGALAGRTSSTRRRRPGITRLPAR